MKPGAIRLISASAGSGKTFRLVEELHDAITRDGVRPEAVVATTFTVKAAAELRERVRSRLLEAGRVEEAQRLGAARIGTVNSVCAQLVGDFAFELGVSPEVQVLDEEAAKEAFNRALSSVVTAVREEDGRAIATASEAGAALMQLAAERWPGLDWLSDVRVVAQRARENGLRRDAVVACAARSASALLSCFGPAEKDGHALDQALEKALATFLAGPLDDTKKTRTVVEFARQIHARLEAGRALAWHDWVKLGKGDVAKASEAAYAPVRAAARGHERHPVLRDELKRCVGAVFELAAEAIERYERYKREWGLMDFVDQEVRALDLLRRPEVQEMLREQVDLVLVDEFQDTSPLQLAIFLALARIAPRSVWVGDQKQAIYGFRGTDPALMDAAIDAIVEDAGEGAYDTLPFSWRSRAELVRLTSELFAPAFEGHGIPSERVRLEPAPDIAKLPDDLGPVVEGWQLVAKNKGDDAAALAEAVRALLADGSVRVRDVTTDKVRGVEAGDIAVLCRKNDDCALVTRALERAGIRGVRPRAGLMKTPEARLVRAALQLWVEPRQPLASAEMGRLLVLPGEADKWLTAVIDAPGKAYVTLPEVERLAAARDELPLAGPLAAFDAAIEAAGVREACLRWGRSPQRLANLDALRADAHRYVGRCVTDGEAATVAGLLACLQELAGGEADEQATLSRENAVTVSTLHGAKGLEWPVTVLHQIDVTRPPSAFGVRVATDRDAFDFSDPLGGRWIRYWPDPYEPGSGNYKGDTALHERVRGGPEHAHAERQHTREILRLLYVGWTRARDRLVLAGRRGKIVGSTLKLLKDATGNVLITEPAGTCTWAGRAVSVQIREAAPADPTSGVAEAGSGYDASGPREFPPASADISKLPGRGSLGEVEVLGRPPRLQLPVDPVALGSAVHAFLAGDRPGLDPGERLAMAAAVLQRWNVQGAMQPEDVVASAGALRAWIDRHWPAATWHREWPLRLRSDEGTELAGYADLVLVDGDRFVLVDHKCPVCTRDQAMAAAAGYAGQVGTYADAIAAATGKQGAGSFLHLVTQGAIVAIQK